MPILVDREVPRGRPGSEPALRADAGRTDAPPASTPHHVETVAAIRHGGFVAALGGAAPPAELVTLLHHETEGNPFFVEEVFRHLSEEGRLSSKGHWRTKFPPKELDVPEGVKLVIGRRLERLSEDARTALTSAALIGPRFKVRVLEALDELKGDALLDGLEEATRARLIDETATGRDTLYAFAHELIRQTLIASLSLPRCQRRHLRIADALERTYGDRIDQHAADMAYHLYFAGAAAGAERTSRFLLRAAEQAIARVAFQDALIHTARGLETAEELTPVDRARLLRAKGLALRGQGRWAEAEAPFVEAAHLFEADRPVCGRRGNVLRARVPAGMVRYEPGGVRVRRSRTRAGRRRTVTASGQAARLARVDAGFARRARSERRGLCGGACVHGGTPRPASGGRSDGL